MFQDVLDKVRKGLFPARPYDPDKFLVQLDKPLIPLAKTFYAKLAEVLPPKSFLAIDKEAPENVNPMTGLVVGKKHPVRKVSLSWHREMGEDSLKCGSARAEIREKDIFIKLVARSAEPGYLHGRATYDIIKSFYPNAHVRRSESAQNEGFALQMRGSLVTMEVFEFADTGNLACDFSVPLTNRSYAQRAIERFVAFFSEIHNLMEGRPKFKVENTVKRESNLFEASLG